MRRPASHAVLLDLRIARQPDDTTCGPTCLHSVYNHFGDTVSLDEVIRTTRSIRGDGGGTLAVLLALHALARGYRARLYTFNLQVFDPTWFGPDGRGAPSLLIDKLRAQIAEKGEGDPRFVLATDAYIDYLRRGGEVFFQDLTASLIAGFIRRGLPILTGVSATYLYRCAREFGPNDDEDDVRGLPAGHFVVLHGYEPARRMVTVADPLEDNPGFAASTYVVPMSRLVPAIMLGVLTYDANLLVIEPATAPPAKDSDR